MRAAGEAKQRAEATQDATEKAALAQLRAQRNRPPGLLTTKLVDMGVQTSLVSDLSIEASRPAQHVVVTKNVEEDVVKNDKTLVEFPLPAVKGTRSRSIRWSCGLAGRPSWRERAKKERGAGEEVGPEGEDEKGGEGAQRRACE